MHKIFVIAGATASGKTAVALSLAEKIGGEIISADSMQVYRGMDIGTAKPTPDELAKIPHHLVSVINPDEQFSAAEFQSRAAAAIAGIRARGRVPIIAGGTGFYINALVYGAEFSDDPRESRLREEFSRFASENGAEALHEKLRAADPNYAATIHPNNVKRVARALAYCLATGKLFSAHNAAQKQKPPIFDAVFFKLALPREILYERINIRTKAMFDGGLADETRSLLAAGYDKTLASMQGIGYKEAVQYLAGEISVGDAIASVAQATRNYAKRQETWLRNQSPQAREVFGGSPEEIAEKILTP
ncbi:MAG: tRNA (adenosine(37)-N6)-dimethylallyltransferase MiaA [Defluviitaleaceae bacterium]|nr:tRNA (adenosine(37)-N6)-dimethylallyltransferase MiaA [Defluviitaleaceae bacterium]